VGGADIVLDVLHRDRLVITAPLPSDRALGRQPAAVGSPAAEPERLVGKPRGAAALLQVAALFEQLVGLNRLLPIDPKPGSVPPTS
jgi:hypothetical protein